MSWDLFVQNIPADARDAADIPDDFEPRPLGSRDEVIAGIRQVVPGVAFLNPSWGTYETEDFSIEFNLGDDETVTSFALHVYGAEAAAGLVADLLTQCGWRAFDPASDSGIFDLDLARKSLSKWRAYRDRASAPFDNPSSLPVSDL
jgi:hypothetical protein